LISHLIGASILNSKRLRIGFFLFLIVSVGIVATVILRPYLHEPERVNVLTVSNASPVTITDIGLFCDSNETNSSSIAYFASVSLKQALGTGGF
jgi:hypothetical protein